MNTIKKIISTVLGSLIFALLIICLPVNADFVDGEYQIIVDNDLTASTGTTVEYDGVSYVVDTDAFDNMNDAIVVANANTKAKIMINQDSTNNEYEIDATYEITNTTEIDCIDFDVNTDTKPILKPSNTFTINSNDAFIDMSGTSLTINNLEIDCDGVDFTSGVLVSDGVLNMDNVFIQKIRNSTIPDTTSPTLPNAIEIDVTDTSLDESTINRVTIVSSDCSGIYVGEYSKVVIGEQGQDDFGLKFYGSDQGTVSDVGVVASSSEYVKIYNSYLYNSSAIDTVVDSTNESTTGIYAQGETVLEIENTLFSQNLFNVVLGESSTDVITATINDCGFTPIQGGENVVIDTTDTFVFDFELNWWGFNDSTDIESYFDKAGSQTISYIPFMMDENRSIRSDNVFEDLLVSTGSLVSKDDGTSSFDPVDFEYTLLLEGTEESIDFTPQFMDANSTVTFVNSGNSSDDDGDVDDNISVPVSSIERGDTDVEFSVSNTDGISRQYIITIHRKYDDVTVNSLVIDNEAVSGINLTTDTWVVDISNLNQKVSIELDTLYSETTYQIDGSQPIDSYSLDVGENNFAIEVTSEDGNVVSNKTLILNRAQPSLDSAYLSSVSIEGASLDDFEYDDFDYYYYLSASTTTSVNVMAATYHQDASISGLGCCQRACE